MSKACTLGKLASCGCDNVHDDVATSGKLRRHYKRLLQRVRAGQRHGRHPASLNQVGPKLVGETFEWGGCSHNVDFGGKFAKRFLNYKEEASDLHSQINIHNNRAGRLVGCKPS